MRFILLVLVFLSSVNFSKKHGNTSIQNPIYPISKKSQTQLLNGSWDFKYIAGSVIPEKDNGFYRPDFVAKDWRKINVPSNWETQGIVEPSYADPKEGIGLYRTIFSVPEKFPDAKDTFIRVEGFCMPTKFILTVSMWGSGPVPSIPDNSTYRLS